MKKEKVVKNYSIIIPGSKPVVIRETTTYTHAVKHACFASELKISVDVRDNRTKVIVISIPAIDKSHAIKATCKRDKRYVKLAKNSKQKRNLK